MRDPRQSVTIKEVAARAGVSLMTVSRVMNNHERVKDSTRDRVKRAMRDLNYRPNINARRLAGGKSLFIGLIYDNPSPSYLTKILNGALDACRQEGHHLVLQDFAGRAANEIDDPEEIARSLRSAGIEAVIITPPLSSHLGLVAAIKAEGLPVVQIAPDFISAEAPIITMDDHAAVRAMMDRLIALGHKRIGFVKGMEDHPSAHHRFSGYQASMKKHGLEYRDQWVREGDFTYRSGFEAGRDLLSVIERPTAIFASNDDMAAGIVSAAYKLGLSVPGDVSVAGFDDTQIATQIWPELTTIRQPIADMARRAIRLIDKSLQDGPSNASKIESLDFEIVWRDTVVAPK